MPTVDHDDFIVRQLQEDFEFFKLYYEDTMREKDPSLFREALQHIIQAKGFNFDVVAKEQAA